MPVTVYFATNRVMTPPGDMVRYYSDAMVSGGGEQVTYGRAFVSDANVTAGTLGTITNIDCIRQGGFDPGVVPDLQAPGENLLLFIHGFGNSFSDAIIQGAYNQQWLAAGGAPSTILSFSWPSIGREIAPPPGFNQYYEADQAMATRSGPHIADFLQKLAPVAAAARASGARVNLLAHSMGNWALANAMTAYCGLCTPSIVFDTAILAAADEVFDSFAAPVPTRLTRLAQVSQRVGIYFSQIDQVLEVSFVVNNVQRMGQLGPKDRNDPGLFPGTCFRMVDCSGFTDYDVNFTSSHQYYHRSAKARANIAGMLAGQ